MERVFHTLDPVYSQESRVLILGSMPSPKSREYGFYYAHPQNRFWKVIAGVYCEGDINTIQKRRRFLLRHNIALWDVLASCDINGASDASIKNPEPNNIRMLLENSKIEKIFTTGMKAYSLYKKLCFKDTGIEAVLLPSTSPANARMSLAELVSAYGAIRALTEGK